MRFETSRWLLCLVFCAGLPAFGAAHDRSGGPKVSMRDGTDAKNWPSYGRTYGDQHYSPLHQINTGNVGRLGLAWSLDLPIGNTTTQPIEVDGVLFFARAYSIVDAVDAVTGKLLWQYNPHALASLYAAGRPLLTWGSRGIAYWKGKVYTITVGGLLIALDCKTGKPVWEREVLPADDKRSSYTVAPRVFNGVVIVGNSGDDGPTRGHVTAFDAQTGRKLWRFWVVPGDPKKGFERPELAMAAKTWSGKWWKYGGNGAAWNAFTYDPETGTVFIGTGNGFPDNWRLRSAGKGDNLFLCSIVALDLKTGKFKWYYQSVPHSMWDYDMSADIELADLKIDGKLRKVLLTAPKNGFFFVLDRITGKFISAEPFVKVTWASHYDPKSGRPVINPAALYPKGTIFTGWPSIFGGHNWQAMSYSPRTKLAYIPIVNLGGTFRDNTNDTVWDPKHGQITGGLSATGDVGGHEATAALIAWDPVKQKQVWRVQARYMVPAGTMATGGGLVFQGAVDGQFSAYSAADGKKLWSYDMQAPGVIAPITYSVHGKQYVTILTGTSGIPAAWGRVVENLKLSYRTMKRRVLTFVLDGKAALPPRVVSDLEAPDDPEYRANPGLAKIGSKLYNGMGCSICHGYEAVSGGRAPDLRYSPVPLHADAFASIVRGGAFMLDGMPKFSSLSDKQLDAIRQYIRAQAHDRALDKEADKTGMIMGAP